MLVVPTDLGHVLEDRHRILPFRKRGSCRDVFGMLGCVAALKLSVSQLGHRTSLGVLLHSVVHVGIGESAARHVQVLAR